ncbi:phage tail tape measure protein [Testudinibacter sp. TR-2022]|uniref:phage tail tape measure protein n=1 Tax=Testudinibacter sp. TR-2022 TaxID=2585029 RepID=UPI001117D6A2|nr:phage tail tape measure protein [Testudinibacter sp. TR-2022]TNH06622.1 phage tail tape measure protein [Pasteurellaceae bacterium Phil11]TNH25539.1 phage tail tape measure protein [Testudinibacter sp. TR-2022]TNH25681.1 phage tail tape measure protein [Testudinibacter sp. TR-2022]
MSGTLGKLNILLGLNSIEFTKGLGKAEYQAQQFAKNTRASLAEVQNSLKVLERSTKLTNLTLWAAPAIGVGKNLVSHMDTYTEIGNRMRLVTSNSVESARAMQSVFDVAMRTNQGVDATAQVYQRFAQNAQQLGINQTQVASLTETVSKAVAISGASAASAQAALMQFGQSLASGIFRGQEFNSVMEQTPGLAQAIAKGLGVTTGELRQMANDGKLTMDVLIPALEKAKASVDQQFATRVISVGHGFQNLKNALIKWSGEMDSTVGITRNLGGALNGLANNLDRVLNVALLTGTAFGVSKMAQLTLAYYQNSVAIQHNNLIKLAGAQAEVRKTSAEVVGTQTSIRYLQAQLASATTEAKRIVLRNQIAAQSARMTTLTNAEAAAVTRLSQAQNAANRFGKAMTFLGGPLGIAATALTLLGSTAYSWYQSAQDAKRATLEFAEALDVSEGALKSMTAAQVEANVTLLSASIDAQSAALENLIKQYERAKQAAKESSITTYDSFGGPSYTYNKSDKEMAEARKEEARLLLEVKNAQDKVAASQQKLSTLTGIQAEKIKQELNSALNDTGIALQQLDPDMQKFALALIDVNSHVLTLNPNLKALMGTTLELAGAAVQAALGLKQIEGVKYSAGAQDEIDRLQRQAKINGAKTDKERIQYQVEDYRAGLQKRAEKDGLSEYDISGMTAAYQETLEARSSNKKSSGSKSGKKEKSLEDWKKDWDSFHDEIQRSNASAMKTIELNELRLSQKVDEFRKQGVISEAEAAAARLQIEQRYHQERLELAGQYNQAIAAQQRHKKIMEDVTALEKEGHLTSAQANEVKAEANWQLWKDQADKSDPLNGMKVAMHDFGKSTEDVMGNVANITQNALGGMSDALTDFVLTGKADFRGLAQSIIKDITGMIIKMMIFNALKSAFGGTAFGDFMGWGQTAARGGLIGSVRVPTTMFDGGGYTGHGNRLTPAGIVHKGEYVLTKEATSRIGRDYLDFLNYAGGRGFANGGGVAVPKVPSIQRSGNSPKVSVKVINNGEPAQAQVSTKQKNGELEITVELMRSIAKQEANSLIQNNFRSGGVFA